MNSGNHENAKTWIQGNMKMRKPEFMNTWKCEHMNSRNMKMLKHEFMKTWNMSFGKHEFNHLLFQKNVSWHINYTRKTTKLYALLTISK